MEDTEETSDRLEHAFLKFLAERAMEGFVPTTESLPVIRAAFFAGSLFVVQQLSDSLTDEID